jgi:hypothetical protein
MDFGTSCSSDEKKGEIKEVPRTMIRSNFRDIQRERLPAKVERIRGESTLAADSLQREIGSNEWREEEKVVGELGQANRGNRDIESSMAGKSGENVPGTRRCFHSNRAGA